MTLRAWEYLLWHSLLTQLLLQALYALYNFYTLHCTHCTRCTHLRDPTERCEGWNQSSVSSHYKAASLPYLSEIDNWLHLQALSEISSSSILYKIPIPHQNLLIVIWQTWDWIIAISQFLTPNLMALLCWFYIKLKFWSDLIWSWTFSTKSGINNVLCI